MKTSGQCIVTTNFFNAIKDNACGYHFDNKIRQLLEEIALLGADYVLINFYTKSLCTIEKILR